jgi:protein-S-isoprenylcysteine O-methyltransferase Ste14
MEQYKNWAKRQYSLKHQLILLGFAGILFLLIIPFLISVSSAAMDGWLNLPNLQLGLINRIGGAILMLGGFSLGFWSVETQVSIGGGTPVPVMPTHKLIVTRPFTYCRNPMTLGTFLGYLGVSIWIGSISAIIIVFLLTILLLIYVRFVEERELEARFGAEYLEYKQKTPFILPRLKQRSCSRKTL